MFDIISFVREKIFRRPKLTKELAGEELSEKQTTKLGYFLLYCMFGAIIASAQWTISIIKDIPNKPTIIPYCINDTINSFKTGSSYGYGYECYDELKSTNPEFDFTTEYNNLKGPYKKILSFKSEIYSLEERQRNLKDKEKEIEQNYNTSLTEKIANENSGLYNKNNIQEAIKNNRLQFDKITGEINDLNNKISEIISKYKTEIEILNTKLIKAENDYKIAYLLYKFYIAFMSFLFSIIVFTILYRIYVKQKIKNSPNAVIFSVATFAYGLILLQVISLFIRDIIPHRLMLILKDLFQKFAFLEYIIQFLWPIFIIAIFGFLVYKIQKRLYSPKNILKRFISDKKCPNCGNGVDFTKPFCPLCSYEIQVNCSSCNKLTVKGMPYCSNCGKKLSTQDL
ncbi:MAG: hypothetical protein PHE25_03090 [Candidatus Gracilibacteria bacterium]|nr:hypothetical protein [Candidatus Gracilibacteria bacterium]